MAGNASLRKADKAKNDEFYTQLIDIENELKHYKKEFEGKISTKDNTYKPSENVVEENIFNKGGKKVEGIIDSGFDILFDIVKGFIDEK